MTNRAFIAFSHRSPLGDELKKYVETHFALTACVLRTEDDLSMTLIEKFEHYATPCGLAFVILTPDDLVPQSASGAGSWRSRQNVILELGWLMRHVGRHRVLLIRQGDIEVPSDMLGVLSLPVNKSIFEVAPQIAARMKTLGVAARDKVLPWR